MAAYREKKTTVIVPRDNESDLKEIDKTVFANTHFVLADNVSDVLDVALVNNAKAADYDITDFAILAKSEPKANRPTV